LPARSAGPAENPARTRGQCLWGAEPTYPSHLVAECHRLRQVPLQDLGPEVLRIQIGQQIGLEYLVPLALEQLSVQPWVSGDLYEGDLLESVLALPSVFWKGRPELEQWMDRTVERALREAQSPRGAAIPVYDPRIKQRLDDWNGGAA
jgi:hypothetical protein